MADPPSLVDLSPWSPEPVIFSSKTALTVKVRCCGVQMPKQTTKKGPKDSWRPGRVFLLEACVMGGDEVVIFERDCIYI